MPGKKITFKDSPSGEHTGMLNEIVSYYRHFNPDKLKPEDAAKIDSAYILKRLIVSEFSRIHERRVIRRK